MPAAVAEEVYRYARLNHEDSFRVLELLPGRASERLSCRLVEVRRTAEPGYQALSYTRGAPNTSKSVTDVESRHCIATTKNLFAALIMICDEDASNIIWVDAICIDQGSVDERSHQVAQMGQIYSNAKTVLVWLGGQDCDQGIDEIERIGGAYESYGFSQVFNSLLTYLTKGLPKTCENLRRCHIPALRCFYNHPWFERVWVLQKVVLAEAVVFHRGKLSSTYDLVSKATAILHLLFKRWKGLSIPSPYEMARGLSGTGFNPGRALIQARERHLAFKQQASEVGPRYPQDLLRSSSLVDHCYAVLELKCVDGRDRVYGVLGLLNETLSIVPDYTQSTEQVSYDLGIKTLLAGDLSVLHSAGISSCQSSSPSFVVDFANLNYSCHRFRGFQGPNYSAGLDVPALAVLTTDHPPMLKTRIIGTGPSTY